MTDRIDPKAIADELRARAETLRAVFPTDGTAWDDARLDTAAADAIEALVKERDQAIRDLDAGFSESDHLSAKYYQRMRAAEREMHARELHHFEEEIGRIQWALSTAPADVLREHDAALIEKVLKDLWTEIHVQRFAADSHAADIPGVVKTNANTFYAGVVRARSMVDSARARQVREGEA